MSAAKPIVRVQTMRLSDGRADHFVSIKVEDREVHPHVFRDEFKAAYHVALYDWLLNGCTEPDLMAFNDGDWPAQTTALVGADPKDIELLQERVSQLEDDLDDARDVPWPAWAECILKTLKSVGYDPVVDGEVDLGEAFKDYLEGVDHEDKAQRATLAAKDAEIARLREALKLAKEHSELEDEVLDIVDDALSDGKAPENPRLMYIPDTVCDIGDEFERGEKIFRLVGNPSRDGEVALCLDLSALTQPDAKSGGREDV